MSGEKLFKAVIEPAPRFSAPGAKDLKITHNGYQWTAITLTPDEMVEVMKLLTIETATRTGITMDITQQQLTEAVERALEEMTRDMHFSIAAAFKRNGHGKELAAEIFKQLKGDL